MAAGNDNTLFAQFVETGSRESFMKLRAAVLESPQFDPYGQALQELVSLANQGKFDAVLARAKTAMPDLLLSSSAHLALAAAHEGLGNQKLRDVERFLAQRCVEGILSTGDGTKDKPYRVLRVPDEYDVLGYLNKTRVSQALTKGGRGSCDRIECDDGSEIWFDITDAMAGMERRMGGSENESGKPAWWKLWRK